MIHIIKPYATRSPALDLRGADFGLFGDLCGRVPCARALERRGTQEHWLIFKDNFLQDHEQCISTRVHGAKMPGGIHRWIRSC